MMLDGERGLTLCIGSADGRVERISTGVPVRAPALHSPAWYFVAASYDAATGRVLLYQQPKTIWPMDDTAAVVESEIGRLEVAENGVPLVMAGYCEGEASQDAGPRVAGHYNGKIDSPALFGRALSLAELDSLRDGASPFRYRVTASSAPGTSAGTSPRAGSPTSPATTCRAARSTGPPGP